MNRLRGGTADLLIATDVAARGLDVDHLTHVVNYNVPSAPESYVHRIGRVGRAGREGVAITLSEPREQRMLQAIERVIASKIPIQPLPTVEDLLARRLGATRTALTGLLSSPDLTQVEALVDELTADHDLRAVALAATLLAHRMSSPPAEDIPEPVVRPVREDVPWKDRQASKASAGRPAGKAGFKGHSASDRGDGVGFIKRAATKPGKARLYIGAGRAAGVRPQDLVGAIAGESHLTGKDIGAIEITERFSLVDVPESEAEAVIKALRSSVIKGRKVMIRLDRDSSS